LEADAAAKVVTRALGHPLVRRAARSLSCRREAPIVQRLADGSLVEGVLDLAFREADEKGPIWTVVDFKTDVEMGGRQQEYERQVSLYAEAVAAATGERVRAALLLV
jgi:ATP-dependent exoDNAse (exonuclease V) beta subunit